MLNTAVEGIVDDAIARRLAREVGFDIGTPVVTNGKARLDSRIRGYNQAALREPWLVLRDLGHDAVCAIALRTRLLPTETPGMRLRITVRSVEAWLLADRVALAPFLGVTETAVPRDPESLSDPKRALVSLARRSRSRAMRFDMVPFAGRASAVGPAYTRRLIEFTTQRWSPVRAAERSSSLDRCLHALRDLRIRYP